MVYALYRGDTFLGAAYSWKDLAAQTGKTVKTLKYMASPAYRRKFTNYDRLMAYRYDEQEA